MGSLVKKTVSKLDPFTARVVDPALGQAGLPNITGNDGGKADALAKAAAEQVQATRQAAEAQAQATQDAAAASTQQAQNNTAAAVSAQTATINQAAMAAQLADQAASAPKEGMPDIQLGGGLESSDPRRRFQASAATSIGGTSGGVGIRL